MNGLITALDSALKVKPDERTRLAWSFAMFFAVLASYFTVRPVREMMGAGLPGGPSQLFAYVLLVMIALVPLFGFLATRLPRRFVLPAVYAFFISNLIAFAVAMRIEITPFVASCFFIWVSVYNLFVVSLFWSLMSDSWSSDQGKRLFGVIAAGGTTGAIAGPILAERLVHVIGTANLPLLSAAFLLLALMASFKLSGGAGVQATGGAAETKPPVTLAAVLEGATRVFQSPYLARIALFIFLANLVSTYFYLEQARLVGDAFLGADGKPDKAARVAFFASLDLKVSIATALIQLFGTARVLARFGLVAALVALPVVCIAGLVGLSTLSTLTIVATIMVIERITAFALAGPAMRVLYTVVDPDEKYKAQNFIDTVVYRGGDALSGQMFDLFGKSLGMPAMIPFAAIWLYASLGLGRMHREKAEEGVQLILPTPA
jgi:ATP:ADP antiporter, AAA family